MTDKVLVERGAARQGHVAHLVFNRPEVLNAVDNELAGDLCAACEQLAQDPTIWVVIVRGAGERAFCAGADVKKRNLQTDQEWRDQRTLFRTMFRLFRDVPQPMIAAVHGFALGGGCEFAMLADIIVAADDAVFGLTEARLGILPGGGGTQTMPRLIGRARAKELMYTARRVDAREAHQLGLVNHVVPRAELLMKAEGLADEIIANSPNSVRQIKWAIDRGADLPFGDALERENDAYLRVIESADRREGIAAFNEKRTPRFSGL